MKFKSLEDCLNTVAADNEGQPEFLQAKGGLKGWAACRALLQRPVEGIEPQIDRALHPQQRAEHRVQADEQAARHG